MMINSIKSTYKRGKCQLFTAGLHRFWASAVQGINLCAPPPLQRWDADLYYSPEAGRGDSIYARFGCFLDNIESFDAGNFGLPKAEALLLDPHARMLLEHTQVSVLAPGDPF